MPARRPEPTLHEPERQRRLRTAAATMRLGVTSFSVLAGIACYAVLAEVFRLNAVVAVLLGLVFALLTRVAAAALARDWLARAASETRDTASHRRR